MLFMNSQKIHHFPVLKKEIVKMVKEKSSDEGKVVFIDCTLGLGGHSAAIIPVLFGKLSRVFLIDKDRESLEIAANFLKQNISFGDRIKVNFVNTSFGQFFENFPNVGEDEFLIVLADLGISYYQLKYGVGFGFTKESFLDMRYDKEGDITAFDVINYFDYEQLVDIFFRVFENIGFAKKLASVIVEERKRKEIRTTFDLNKTVSKYVSAKILKDTLQKLYLSLRIYVNRELEELEKLLNFFKKVPNRFLLLIISYHSLEGKIIKKFYKELATSVKVKKIKPSKEEILANKPSRSAILWVIEK